MDVWVGQIVADLSQAPRFDAKAESRTNKTCQAGFESILGMLIASEHQVQSASPIKVEQAGSEVLPICDDGSTTGLDFQEAQVVVSDDQSLSVGSAHSTQQGQINPNAVVGRQTSEIPGSLLILSSSFAQIRLTSSGKDQMPDLTLPTQGLPESGQSADTAGSRTHNSTCAVVAQDAKDDPVSLDVLRDSNDLVLNQRQAIAVKDWLGFQNSAGNWVAIDGSDQAIKFSTLTYKPWIHPQNDSVSVLGSSRSNPWILKAVEIHVDPKPIGDLGRLQADSKMQPSFAIGRPIPETQMPRDLLPRHLKMGSAIDLKAKMASSADLLPEGLLKGQSAVEDLEESIDVLTEEIKPQIYSMESPNPRPGNSICQLAKQVLLRQQIGLDSPAYKAATVKAEAVNGQTHSLPSQTIESLATRDQVRSPIQINVSNRKQIGDSVAVLIDSLRGLLKSQDLASVEGEPKATGACSQIFDRIIDEIPKSIGEGHQVSLRISTDQGEKIEVDISVISNQVRARISVADVELRDLLASHGWLLVQRFEANGLVAQEIEFSLLGEKDMTENRRAKKWVDDQSSVDDLEEVLSEFDLVGVKSTGFDRFA